MKQPWEWEEEDLLGLINEGVQESLTLDYKQSAALDKRNPKSKSDLSKDVSAFANSAGGVLVYGIVEEDNHLPVKIDAGLDPLDITREWIEQVINSTIQQRIDGFRIKQVLLKQTNPGRVGYVIYVPQSTRAPHMASDHIFYKRYNYQSIAMEEYEVRDVSRRLQAPDLRVELSLNEGNWTPLKPGLTDTHFAKVYVNVDLVNDAISPADYAFVRLFVSKKLLIGHYSPFRYIGEEDASDIGYVTVYEMRWGIPLQIPIWKGANARITDSSISVAIPRTDNSVFDWYWEAYSPAAAPRTGRYFLRVRGASVLFEDLGWKENELVKRGRLRSPQ